MPLSVEITGLDKLVADAEHAGGDAKLLVKAAITNSVNRIQGTARSLAPHRTGTLQRSILTQVDYPNGQVQVNEKYGKWIEGGTGIYAGNGRIVPKTAKALAFKQNGSLAFYRSVKGMKARPFFKPAVEASAEYISEQFTKVIDKLATGLAGRGF